MPEPSVGSNVHFTCLWPCEMDVRRSRPPAGHPPRRTSTRHGAPEITRQCRSSTPARSSRPTLQVRGPAAPSSPASSSASPMTSPASRIAVSVAPAGSSQSQSTAECAAQTASAAAGPATAAGARRRAQDDRPDDPADQRAEQQQPDDPELGRGLDLERVRVADDLRERPVAQPQHAERRRTRRRAAMVGERRERDLPVGVAVGVGAAEPRGGRARRRLLGPPSTAAAPATSATPTTSPAITAAGRSAAGRAAPDAAASRSTATRPAGADQRQPREQRHALRLAPADRAADVVHRGRAPASPPASAAAAATASATARSWAPRRREREQHREADHGGRDRAARERQDEARAERRRRRAGSARSHARPRSSPASRAHSTIPSAASAPIAFQYVSGCSSRPIAVR